MSAAQFPIIGYAVGLLLFAFLLLRSQRYGWTNRKKVEIIVLVVAIAVYHLGQDAFLWLTWGPTVAVALVAWGLVLFGSVDPSEHAAMIMAESLPSDQEGVERQLTFIENLPFWTAELDERRSQLLQLKQSYTIGGLEV